MSYVLRNKTSQQIVCDLNGGSTFRLSAGKEIEVKELTPYLQGLVRIGDLVVKKVEKEETPKVVVKATTTTTTTPKQQSKRKSKGGIR